jgi:N-acetylglucosamine kinase-like BadF-type ATPase
MNLIADSGSTKTEWVVTDKETRVGEVFTQGINPYFQDEADILNILRQELIPHLGGILPEAEFNLYFYGAGVSTHTKVDLVTAALKQVFPHATIVVEHDLLAAARALCGKEKGIACILGTGSNSCLFDGKEIIANNPSLGFIMGDEGSGGHIGKELLKMFMYHELEPTLRAAFIEAYNTDKEAILNEVYHKPLPNRYCASFMHFVGDHKDHPQMRGIVNDSMNEFFKRHVTKYAGYRQLPFHCLGSVGLIFKDVLEEVAAGYGVKVQRVLREPMEGLISFHA